jgi:hypothetical protein
MRSKILSLLLVVVLACVNAPARQVPTSQSGSMEAQIRALGQDSLIEVRKVDGSRLRGWIGAISDSGFELRLGKSKLETLTLDYAQVRSAKAVKSLKPSHTGRNILIGAGIAVAAIGLGIIIAAKRVGYI